MPLDGAFKTHTSLRHNLYQTYFRTTEQNESRLDAICQSKTPGTTLHEETHITRKPAFVGQFIYDFIQKFFGHTEIYFNTGGISEMYFDEVKKNFGFGCMRLPMMENGTDVDIAETTKMVDLS